jgi:hypothetical protein
MEQIMSYDSCNEEQNDFRPPFEGIFGDTSELRIVQFLMAVPELQFTSEEIQEGENVPKEGFDTAIDKLVSWNVVKKVEKNDEVLYFMSRDNNFMVSFEDLNNSIIIEILDRQEGL